MPILTLDCVRIPPFFPPFIKGDIVYDFILSFLQNETFLKRNLLLKAKYFTFNSLTTNLYCNDSPGPEKTLPFDVTYDLGHKIPFLN